MIFRKNSHGIITVFISLMLVSILSLGTLVIEIARFQSAKNQLAEATISASTSMIADYDSDLYKRYGLLAVKDDEIDEAKATDYLNYNSDLSANAYGNNISRQYSISSVEVKGMYNLSYPSVLKRQILSRAKYNIVPQDYALNRYNYDRLLSQYQTECEYITEVFEKYSNGGGNGEKEDVPEDVQKALAKMNSAFKGIQRADTDYNATISSNSMSNLPTRTGVKETKTPDEDVELINELKNDVNSVIGADASELFSTPTTFSDTSVAINARNFEIYGNQVGDGINIRNFDVILKDFSKWLVTYAKKVNAAINLLEEDADSTLLLNSYITEFFSSRSKRVKGYSGPSKGSAFTGENGNFVSACVEYIFGGNESEITNQKVAYNYLIAIRMIDNLYCLLNSSNCYVDNNKYSAMAHIAWAYYESYADSQLMARYNTAIPLFKSKLIFDINSSSNVETAFATSNLVTAFERLGIYNSGSYNVSGTNKFTYLDTLSFALWFIPNSLKLSRLSDLIQLEMRYDQQYINGATATFLMSDMDTYCRVKVKAKLNSVLPVISANQGQSIQDIQFNSTKYSGF